MATKATKKRTITQKSPKRIGVTRLSNKSSFRSWMIVPVVALVAIAGYIVINYSQASGCRYNYCWGASQFRVDKKSSIVSPRGGQKYWDSSRSKPSTSSTMYGIQSATVYSNVRRNQYYCINAKGKSGANIAWGYIGWGYTDGITYIPSRNGVIKGCTKVTAMSVESGGRTPTPARWVGVHTKPGKRVLLYDIFRSDKKIY